MSHIIWMDQRLRWKSRSVVLERWLTNGTLRRDDPVCEILVDGVRHTIRATTVNPQEIDCVSRTFVRQGEEVPPTGFLLETHNNANVGLDPSVAPLNAVARTRRVPRPSYPRVFISYRRSDSEAYAGRLHEVMTNHYGQDSVFMDQFSIRPGEVFPWTIQQAAAGCQLMVVVVGPTWLSETDAYGKRRIDSSMDFVHREVCTALDRAIPIVPVLTQRATIPTREELPQDLEGLEHVQFLELTARHWTNDVRELLTVIEGQTDIRRQQ